MFIDFNILDITILGYYTLISTTSFESLGILVGTIIAVITELWYNNSQLFGILYTLIYVGAVVILFVFILSVLNKKEEYEYEYNSLIIILLILLIDDLDIYDYHNFDINNEYIYEINNLWDIISKSEMSTLGNIIFTEYGIILILLSLILLLSIIGLIIVVLRKDERIDEIYLIKNKINNEELKYNDK